ncbi:IS66 family transposase [Azorhizophilus paspali]|uniref:Transposase n=1 Tax=Azorhizophilus paspali TaxID=69963 RepID=A0ABV6SKW3_AZOPA
MHFLFRCSPNPVYAARAAKAHRPPPTSRRSYSRKAWPIPACWRFDGLPLHRFEKVLASHGIEIPRQTLARWAIQCGEQLQPLLNLMRDRLLESPVIHCDETQVQVLKEPDRDPSSQS